MKLIFSALRNKGRFSKWRLHIRPAQRYLAAEIAFSLFICDCWIIRCTNIAGNVHEGNLCLSTNDVIPGRGAVQWPNSPPNVNSLSTKNAIATCDFAFSRRIVWQHVTIVAVATWDIDMCHAALLGCIVDCTQLTCKQRHHPAFSRWRWSLESDVDLIVDEDYRANDKVQI